jgi:hypothetical protein
MCRRPLPVQALYSRFLPFLCSSRYSSSKTRMKHGKADRKWDWERTNRSNVTLNSEVQVLKWPEPTDRQGTTAGFMYTEPETISTWALTDCRKPIKHDSYSYLGTPSLNIWTKAVECHNIPFNQSWGIKSEGTDWQTVHKAVLTTLTRRKITEQVRLEITLSACIREVPGSNLGRDTDYPEVFRGFPKSVQANTGKSTSIRRRWFPSKSFPIYQSSHDPTPCSLDTQNRREVIHTQQETNTCTYVHTYRSALV